MESFIHWYIENHEAFEKALTEKKSKLLYTMNLLDEINVYENAHSRILARFLQYPKKDYFILKSFLQFLESPFNDLLVSSPSITAEKDRIDVRIRDKSYSIIIENKIHGANDTDDQIDKYNKVEQKAGGDNIKIYVLYLTHSGGAPAECSISRKEWNDGLNIMFKEISYKEHILPWVKELEHSKDFSKIPKNELMLLKSALVQYKNHLQGMFYEREGEKQMEAEMKQYLKANLGLNEDPSMNVDKLTDIDGHLKTISDMQKFLFGIKEDIAFNLLEKVYESLKEAIWQGDLSDFVSLEHKGKFGERDSVIYFVPKGWNEKYAIGFGFDGYLDKFFYGIYCPRHNGSEHVSRKLSSLFNSEEENKYWSIWSLWYYVEGFISIKDDINLFIKSIQNDNFTRTILDKLKEIYKNAESVEELKEDNAHKQ